MRFGFGVIAAVFPIYLLWNGRLAGYLSLATSSGTSSSGMTPLQAQGNAYIVPNAAPGVNATPGISY